MQSIEISPSTVSLNTTGIFQQYKVIAKFSNGKTKDFTTRAKYTVEAPTGPVFAPLSAVALTDSGRIQVVNTACTFSSGVSYPYVVTATFETFESKSFVNVNTAAGCDSTAAGTEPMKIVLPGEQ